MIGNFMGINELILTRLDDCNCLLSALLNFVACKRLHIEILGVCSIKNLYPAFPKQNTSIFKILPLIQRALDLPISWLDLLF